MKNTNFDVLKKRLEQRYGLDLIHDLILSPDDLIILFADLSLDADMTLELISGNLGTIGLDNTATLPLKNLLNAFDFDNAYAVVAGEAEHYNAVRDEILDFKRKPMVTFPIKGVSGKKHWIRLQVVPVEKQPTIVTFFITNLSNYMMEEESIYHKTHHDSLTGLFNKYTLDFHYGQRYRFKDFHVMFLDLDNFKDLNDDKGHNVGNAFLKGFADILKEHQYLYNRFYRIGGDEFVGLCFKKSKQIQEDAAAIIAKTAVLAQQYGTTYCSVSIGIVKAEQRQDVIRKADMLLYKAKQLGKNRYVFDKESTITIEDTKS